MVWVVYAVYLNWIILCCTVGLSSGLNLARNFEEDQCSGEEAGWKETALRKDKNMLRFFD